MATYAEAFGYKVDRIANYLKAQKAEAELAQREAERFQVRYKAAENREKRLKADARLVYDLAEHAEVAGFPEYDQPAGQQRAFAGDPRDYAHSRQLLIGRRWNSRGPSGVRSWLHFSQAPSGTDSELRTARPCRRTSSGGFCPMLWRAAKRSRGCRL